MSTKPKIEYIDYVIVVHGIGEQRPNETVMPVINRFAELRYGKKKPDKKHVVTLGMITAQTGRSKVVNGKLEFGEISPWAEFKNIPQKASAMRPGKEVPFYGEPSYNGKNLRFVDMHWADIMQENFELVGQDTREWADSLIGRLELRQKHKDLPTSENWVLPILYRLEETLVTIQAMMSFRMPGVSDEIFKKFLGDVQLYGEYVTVRGLAVHRFHHLMNKIEQEHMEYHQLDRHYRSILDENHFIKPRYTIIAHSLGTVMSMDALMYAHIKRDTIQGEVSEYENLPFPEYYPTPNHDELFGDQWIHNIDSYVTLGSPIDKFLTIWWQNYHYLGNIKDGIVPEYFGERESKIKHFNYCDEQDPVGHSLDLLAKIPSFAKFFDTKEDMVYNRYAVPGEAHVNYWEDIELFRRILEKTIDAPKPYEPQGPSAGESEFSPFKKGIYWQVLFFSYFLFPIISIAASVITLYYAFKAKDLSWQIIYTTIFSAAWFVNFRFIKLMVWWRQMLRIKRDVGASTAPTHTWSTTGFYIILIGLIGFHSVLTLMYIPSFINHSNIEGSALIDVGVWTMVLGTVIYYKFRSLREIKIKDYSVSLTFTFTAIISVAVLIAKIVDFDPLNGILPYDNLPLALYSAISMVLWFYTLACIVTAKNALVSGKAR